MKLIKRHLPLIIFLTLYFGVIAYKLISHPTPFYDWDEAINVQVTKETINKFSLVPLWQGEPWLDKPPLPFLLLGAIMKLTPFVQAEISLRIISLLLTIISLIFVYAVFLKASHGTSAVEESDVTSDGRTAEVDKVVALLTVIVTAFTPIFLQRSQIVNLDVFLLIGWLGYLLFVQNFWLSLFFLAISVLSKSLLGFYPALILLFYKLITWWVLRRKGSRKRAVEGYQIRSEHLREGIRNRSRQIIIQVLILSSWYLIMFFFFGKDFWQQHIIETHFRRVTASIESHFGQRTYYLDLMKDQIGIFFWFSLLGLGSMFWQMLRHYFSSKRSVSRNILYWFSTSSNSKLLYSLFLLPWFIFLNLTKTKIFWYLYPAIPLFAFLAIYPLHVILNGAKRSEESSASVKRPFHSLDPSLTLRMTAGLLIIAVIFYQNFIKTSFLTTFYSKSEDYHKLALYAKTRCDSLSVLVGKETREATKTLENLGLTITSTKQWGDHPSIVYYFSKKVDFIYDKNILEKKLPLSSKNSCLLIRNDDLDLELENQDYKKLKNLGSFYLFKR